MTLKIVNNAKSELLSGISDTATTIVVKSGEGALFPTITTEYFYATIALASAIEIVKVTARTGDSFTVVRAQDGSTAQSFIAGAKFEMRWNVAQVEDFIGDKDSINIRAPGVSTTSPTITDNGDGTINLSSCLAFVYPGSTSFPSKIGAYTIPAITNQAFTDQTQNYLYIDYNSGSPIYKVTTNVALIDFASAIPVITIYRDGTELHFLSWSTQADNMIGKSMMRIVRTNRFGYESGLILSETGTRNIAVTAGKVWYGFTTVSLDAFTSVTDSLYFYKHVGGVWTVDKTTTQYNNTQYDNGTDLVTLLNNNRYTINWIYRGIESTKHCYYVLGNTEYSSLADAMAAQPRSDLPSIITSHTMLVGYIIVKKNGATASAIGSAFAQTFAASAAAMTDIYEDSTGYLSLTAGGSITLNTMPFQQYVVDAATAAGAILSTTPFGATLPTKVIDIVLIGNSNANPVGLRHNDASGGCILAGDWDSNLDGTIHLRFFPYRSRYVEISRSNK